MKDNQQDNCIGPESHSPLSSKLGTTLCEYKFPAYTEPSSQQWRSLHSENALGNSLEARMDAGHEKEYGPIWNPGYQSLEKNDTPWWHNQHRYTRRSVSSAANPQFKKITVQSPHYSNDVVPQSPALMSSRANSLFSVMTESSKSDHSSPTAYKPTHRRSSAISLDKDCIRRSGILKSSGKGSGLDRKSDRLVSGFHGRSGSSTCEAPFKIIAPSSGNLRRKSEPHFITDFEQFQRAYDRLIPIPANVHESNRISFSTTNNDVLGPVSLAPYSCLQNSSPKEGQIHEALLPPIEFSDSSSRADEELPKKDGDELLSLKEFLESTP
ncbi:uncharacterized protein LALA0_S04e04258g [Lachancea lanzarotensis]|uniref:LALA0S04e04258g1_1 n=1 Tax=Lachancea lanzarotensis TaxID=1245769 RepID=A0A0C7N950_9SACH|nr:uncharacterized protein LALA0_S04e04258g [Lachancea lanzarotensis]CEP61947.1 LALA0S04e04258g1_1 [Lachancea lanzarotensis]